MPKWTHGAGGVAFDVQPGDVWRVAGVHWVACGDVQAGQLHAFAERFCPPGLLVVTDPPWNQTMAKAFRTRAGEAGHMASFEALIEQFFDAIRVLAPRVCVVEMGKQHAGAIEAQMKADWGYHHTESTSVPYGRSTSVLVAGAREAEQLGTWKEQPTEKTSYREVMRRWLGRSTKAPNVVLDPFCGLGLIPRAVVQAGGEVRGFELHPNRVSRTLVELAKLTGATPEKAGRL